MNTEELKLTDNAISHIAQLLQMAILTGTDVMDNLRSATFVAHEGTVDVHPDYQETFQEGIQRMVDAVQDVTSNEEDTDE
jgi:hypothetical protein